MTVKRLKELLEDVPDETKVYTAVDRDITDDVNFLDTVTGILDADGDVILV